MNAANYASGFQCTAHHNDGKIERITVTTPERVLELTPEEFELIGAFFMQCADKVEKGYLQVRKSYS